MKINSIWGVDCNFVKVIGNRIQNVFSPNGEKSQLYESILDHIKNLSKEEVDKLKDQYRSWEGDIIGSIDDNKHLALAIYSRTKSENFKKLGLSKDNSGDHLFKDVKFNLLSSPDLMSQLPDESNKTIPSKQSDVTVKAHKEFLNRNGFDIKELTKDMTDSNGNKVTLENSINFTDQLVKVVDGEQATALGEESTHLAVRMIKQKFPSLFKEMMNKVGSYQLYENVLNQYRDHPNYTNEDGKPNIPKIKEETVGKVLNEYITKGKEGTTEKPELLVQAQSWWKRIVESLKSLFSGNGFNPYVKAAEKFEKGDLDTKLDNIKTKKNELQNIIRRDGKTSEGSTIQSIYSYLTRGEGADSKGSPSIRAKAGDSEGATDESEIKKYIENNDLWYKTDLESLEYAGHGAEAKVYHSKENPNNVVKTNNLIYYKSWKDYLQHLQIHNILFPETKFELKGFVEKDGKLQSIVEQPFIKGQALTDRNKLYDFLFKNGWDFYEPNKDLWEKGILKDNYENKELGLLLYDLHKGNVLEAPNGALFFIDTQFFTTSRFYENSDKMNQLPEEDEGTKLFKRITGESKANKITDAEGNSKYETTSESGVEVKVEKRVTDYPKEIYKEAFKNRVLTDADEKSFAIDKAIGTAAHADIDDILSRSIDKTTGIRNERISPRINESKLTPGDATIYSKLEDYITNTLDRFPKNTRFIWEQVLYKPGKKPGKGDLAGTVDFVAITPDGVTYNLDWKFMNEKNRTDITTVTKKAHRSQMGWYGTMLRDYGVKDLRESRTIPFKIIYGKGTDNNKILRDIVIGDPDYKNITDKTLLPLPSKQEQAGIEVGNNKTIEDKAVTAFVRKLNILLEQMENNPPKGKDWQIHNEKVQQLSNAIRNLLVKKDINDLINFGEGFINSKINSIKSIQSVVTEGKKDQLTPDEINKLGYDLIEANLSADAYIGLENTFLEYLKEMPKEDLDPIMSKLSSIGDRAEFVKRAIYNKETKQGLIPELGYSIAKRAKVYNLMSSEVNVKQLAKLFNTLSAARTKTTQVLFKLVNPALSKADLIQKEQNKTLKSLEEGVKKWNGDSWNKAGLARLKKMMFQKDSKGNWKPNLIGKYSPKFYKELADRQDENNENNRVWIKANIDQEAYKESYEKYLKQHIEAANERVFDYNDPAHDESLREQYIEHYKDTHDIDRPTAFTKANYMLKYFPTDENHSDEYKEMLLSNNKPILDLYDHIHKMNKKAHEIGLIGNYYSMFFPQIRRGFIESITHGVNAKSTMRNLVSGFITEPGDEGYRDPNTGEPMDKIHARYMHDLGEEIEGSKEKDYSVVSDDIFKVLEMFNGEILKYEALTGIEGQVKILENIEANKESLITHKGKIVKTEEGTLQTSQNNRINIDYLKNYISYAMYGKKHIGDDIGMTFSVNDKDYHLSVPKTIDTINRYISLKILGINPGTAISNLFGGTANSYINSGLHITKNDLNKAFGNVIQAKFMSGRGAKLVKLLDHFVPFTEDLGRELGRHMSMNSVQKYLSSDGLMTFMRKSDNIVQMINADAFFENTMIENGKLVNIREYARNIHNYADLYKEGTTSTQRTELKNKIEKEIVELKKKNLYNDKNIEWTDKGITLKGVDRFSESEVELRNRIQQLTRDCLGNRTPEEIAQINMTLFGSSAMMFKNWVPRLAQKRFGDFKFTPGADTYEIGRARMLADALRSGVNSKISTIKSLISYGITGKSGENSLIGIAKREYQRKILQQRELEQVSEGESMFEKTVSEAQFVDNYLKGVKAQVRELGAMLGLMIVYFAAKANAPTQDDDYKTKGIYRYSVRMLDKLSDELGFFYSPNSAKQILGNGGLPVMSMLLDIEKFMQYGSEKLWFEYTPEKWGRDIEKADKIHAGKYLLNEIGVINQLDYHIALFNQDFADFLGIKPKASYQTR